MFHLEQFLKYKPNDTMSNSGTWIDEYITCNMLSIEVLSLKGKIAISLDEVLRAI